MLRMQPHVVPVYNLVVYYKLTLSKVVLTNTKNIQDYIINYPSKIMLDLSISKTSARVLGDSQWP